MGCGEFIVKYILFFVNLFFALAGLALIGLGIAVQLQFTIITNLIEGTFEVAPIITIVVGSIIFFIAFLGCCGAIKESNCLLVSYAIFMIILMILKITLVSLIFVNLGLLKEQIPVWLNSAFNRPNMESFYVLQSAFRCCGTTGPLAYLNPLLPPSCCPGETITGHCNIVEAFTMGCNEALVNFFDVFGTAIGVVAIVVVAIELVAVVFSLCLANHARNKARRMRY